MTSLRFPYRRAGGRTATASRHEHVRQMILQLLFTAPGERVNRPDFGVGVPRYVFEPAGPEIASALTATLDSQLRRFLGDVIDVESVRVAAEDAVIGAEIRYSIRETGETFTDTFRGGPAR